MVNIIQKFIPESQTNQRPGGKMNPEYITVHNTANTNKGADAEMHSRYLLNGAGGRTVGWHFTVDDKEVYQHLPLNEHGWHAGDGGNGTGNRKSIGIEICENEDGDFGKAVSNAVWLIQQLMNEHTISIEKVVTHKHWSGKNCPRRLLDQWTGFKKRLDNSKENTYVPPKQEVKSDKVTTYKGDSIVDYLNSIGKNSSFKARKKYAADYGIKNYKGTAAQNIELLNKMRKGKPASKPKPTYIGKRVESIHNGQLRFYNKASWSDAHVAGYLKKGYGFPTIVSKVKVGKGYQYKVKNSKGATYYVTASSKYIKVE
ncbi:peptidoglycan recognition protein family protein [Virgibacillus sp. MG-45]|uniref:peptidoglycan recognition protein family protein n=1 Tax=Virgibacillus sp. MG-45 TaxID=3102791 RepID=UPI002ED8DB39